MVERRNPWVCVVVIPQYRMAPTANTNMLVANPAPYSDRIASLSSRGDDIQASL
jgi:hypothetical protein